MFPCPLYVLVSLDVPKSAFDWNELGERLTSTAPAMSFVPDFVTALIIAPEVLPNSAEMPPFFTLKSAMSSWFVSTPRKP